MAPMNLALFRVDASPATGIGHVMRCLTLADALGAAGWRCRFASTVETIALLPALASPPVTPLGPAETADTAALARAVPEGADVLVVDHYGLDARYERAARPLAKRIVVIDDLADRPHDCDLLVDQSLGRAEDDYRFLVPGSCRLLVGPQFALLRRQFALQRTSATARRSEPRPPARLLISLGGTDSLDVTDWALDALAASGVRMTTDVVLGSGAPHLERLRARVASLGGAVLHVGADEMATLMLEADLAIGAAGTSSWERCCLGLPTLLVVTADNQRQIAQALAVAGAAVYVGQMPGTDRALMASALARLASDPAALCRMSAAAGAICDGQGASRVAAAISDMVGCAR
jgi:UDP-2,4-diacetamido-2,4,6-trideoxy-beta-L-altropyranose hydrolase